MATATEVQHRLGRRIRQHRQRVGLTQVELAESIGLDASTVRALESGRRGCSLHVLVNLAEKLGVTPGELLNQDAKQKGSISPGVSAAQIVESLEPRWQETAVDLLKLLKRRTEQER